VDGNPDRRTTSEAVVSYLGVLSDPSGRICGMSAIFSCWSGCERDGRLQSLIIDGTVTGILSELPAFTRSVISVPGMKSRLVQLLCETRTRVPNLTSITLCI
jgi:hypothetical protein